MVGGSSPSCIKLTKSLQQAFNPKSVGSFGLSPKLGGPVYHNNIVGTVKIRLCQLHIRHVLRLLCAVSQDVLHFISLWITLTVSEVAGTDHEVTSKLPLLLVPSSIARMQS